MSDETKPAERTITVSEREWRDKCFDAFGEEFKRKTHAEFDAIPKMHYAAFQTPMNKLEHVALELFKLYQTERIFNFSSSIAPFIQAVHDAKKLLECCAVETQEKKEGDNV